MPRPTAIEAALQFRQQLNSLEMASFRRMSRIYARLMLSVSDEVEKLAAEIADMEEPKRADILKLARMRRILRQVEIQAAGFVSIIENEVVFAQEDGIQLATQSALRLIEASLPPDMPDALKAQVIQSFTALDSDVIVNVAGLIGDDSPLRTKIESDFGEGVAGQVEQHLLDGIVRGQNPQVIARRLASNLETSMGSGLRWAMSTVRTAQIKSYQLANHATYQANSHIVPAWIWHSALDDRTCLSCISQHGTEHPITERLNDHHNGRCAPLPKAITYADLGLNVKERPVETVQGEQWFRQQPTATRRAMMGPAMYEAYKKGEFAFEDLSQPYDDEVYGELLRQASLKDLLGRRAKEFYAR